MAALRRSITSISGRSPSELILHVVGVANILSCGGSQHTLSEGVRGGSLLHGDEGAGGVGRACEVSACNIQRCHSARLLAVVE